jgi:HPt (histidine-containing phosphotransfer) domain-containing protein
VWAKFLFTMRRRPSMRDSVKNVVNDSVPQKPSSSTIAPAASPCGPDGVGREMAAMRTERAPPLGRGRRAAHVGAPFPSPSRPRARRARAEPSRDGYGDLAAQLLAVFAASSASTIAELREATGDPELTPRLAHRLKGSARNVGATATAEHSVALEAAPGDAAILERLAASLAPTYAALRGALQA